MKSVRIALLEDEPAQAELLERWLEESGYQCTHFTHGRALLRSMARDTYDLAILDWGLPDMSGDDVLSEIRATLTWRIPVLFITSRDEENDIVRALNKGADDYMSKPVRREETLARVGALLRRMQPDAEENTLSVPPWQFDAGTGTVTLDGEPVTLTRKEFDLAFLCFSYTGRLLSRRYLLEVVWGTSGDLNTRTVDTHMSRIRTKLEINPGRGWRLSSVYQHGYRLEKMD